MAGISSVDKKISLMTGSYLKTLGKSALRGDAFTIAAALLIALAVFTFLQTLVEGLIAPAVAAVFGKPNILLLSFTVNYSEFSYGNVLVGLILLVLTLVVVVLLGTVRQSDESRSNDA